ncbi:MAG: hypothetical protein JO282_08525 [Alphaproteobacteria bacterium]|nr:hypothetical protein [Alphaproteobacteria bacterium]
MLEAAKGFGWLKAYGRLSALLTALAVHKPSKLSTAILNRLPQLRKRLQPVIACQTNFIKTGHSLEEAMIRKLLL